MKVKDIKRKVGEVLCEISPKSNEEPKIKVGKGLSYKDLKGGDYRQSDTSFSFGRCNRQILFFESKAEERIEVSALPMRRCKERCKKEEIC